MTFCWERAELRNASSGRRLAEFVGDDLPHLCNCQASSLVNSVLWGRCCVEKRSEWPGVWYDQGGCRSKIKSRERLSEGGVGQEIQHQLPTRNNKKVPEPPISGVHSPSSHRNYVVVVEDRPTPSRILPGEEAGGAPACVCSTGNERKTTVRSKEEVPPCPWLGGLVQTR